MKQQDTPYLPNGTRQVLWAILMVGVVATFCYPFAGFIGYRSVALILLLTVSVMAMRMGLTAVLVAATLSALVWDFFFIPPYFTLTIDNTEDALLLAMYFIVASLNGVINHRLRQMAQLRRETEERDRSLKLYNALFNALSHDLRTPIAAILGAVDTLQDKETTLSEFQQRALFYEITEGALRLNEQLENLLNVSRLEAGAIHPHRSWCDMGELIRGVIAKMPPPIEGRTVEVVIEKGTPLVKVDQGLMKQIVQNLLSNAHRHTPPSVQVSISAKIVHDAKGHFEIPDWHDAADTLQAVSNNGFHRLLIEVRDNGTGIPELELSKIFDRFYRIGASKADGTGLGLFVVKGFTEAQHGQIEAYNHPEGGLCLRLDFPTKVLAIA